MKKFVFLVTLCLCQLCFAQHANKNERYTLYIDATISIELYDTFGKKVKVIAPKQNQKAGTYSVQTSVSDLIVGTYIIKMSDGSQTESKQLVINK